MSSKPLRSATSDDHTSRLTSALVEAGMALGSALSLPHVLQIIVDVSRELVDARYAALGVINAERTGLSDFVTSGMSPEVRARIGSLPTGKGILGLLIREAKPLRLRDMREHPASAGVPRHHPIMRSFMGVPITAQGRVFGNLYVTEKIGATEFTESDLSLLEVLATQAAVAIENAQLRTTRDRVVVAAQHALGNALSAVRVWSSSLLASRPSSPDEWARGVRQIAGSAAQATRLVEDLILLSQIQENALDLQAGPVDVARVIRGAVEELAADADNAGVRIEASVDGPLVIELDEARARHVVRNILASAIAVSPAGTAVRITSRREVDGGVDVRIQDRGPPPADSDALFEPQMSRGVHTSGRQFGFELAVSRQLARLMGGDVTVAATREGALFTLSLPLVMRSA